MTGGVGAYQTRIVLLILRNCSGREPRHASFKYNIMKINTSTVPSTSLCSASVIDETDLVNFEK